MVCLQAKPLLQWRDTVAGNLEFGLFSIFKPGSHPAAKHRMQFQQMIEVQNDASVNPNPKRVSTIALITFNFAKKGVPALFPDAGVEYIGKPEGYGKTKRDEYTSNHYHAPSDQVKPDWDLSGAAEDAKLFLAVGYRVAQAEKIPGWKPGNEFKSTRDKTLVR